MALLATRRLAPLALRRATRSVVPLHVRAFKEDTHAHKKASDKPKEQPEASAEVAKTQKQAPAVRHAPAAGADLAAPLRMRSLFDEMEREMNQLTRAFFGDDTMMTSPFSFPGRRHRALDPFESVLGAAVPALKGPGMMMRLATDVHEDDKGYTIKADVPGMSKDDVKVTYDDGVLTITGERKHEAEEEEESTGQVKWIERSHGSFVRSFALPSEVVDTDHISASIKDGVMRVVIPKVPAPPKPEAKEIPICESSA